MKIQPKYTLIPNEYAVFPIDAWSRKHIRALCDDLCIKYIELSTTMNSPALQFSQQDYKNITEYLKDYTVDG